MQRAHGPRTAANHPVGKRSVDKKIKPGRKRRLSSVAGRVLSCRRCPSFPRRILAPLPLAITSLSLLLDYSIGVSKDSDIIACQSVQMPLPRSFLSSLTFPPPALPRSFLPSQCAFPSGNQSFLRHLLSAPFHFKYDSCQNLTRLTLCQGLVRH